MRLIDADELSEYIGREALDTREKIFALVDRMPTIEPRPHGEWIKVEFRTKEEKLFYGDAYRCSHCKVISDTHGSAPYCENCGADMSANDRQVTGKLDDNTTLLYSMTNGDNFIGREGEKE